MPWGRATCQPKPSPSPSNDSPPARPLRLLRPGRAVQALRPRHLAQRPGTVILYARPDRRGRVVGPRRRPDAPPGLLAGPGDLRPSQRRPRPPEKRPFAPGLWPDPKHPTATCPPPRAEAEAEAAGKKPLAVILDQAEEAFTRPLAVAPPAGIEDAVALPPLLGRSAPRGRGVGEGRPGAAPRRLSGGPARPADPGLPQGDGADLEQTMTKPGWATSGCLLGPTRPGGIVEGDRGPDPRPRPATTLPPDGRPSLRPEVIATDLEADSGSSPGTDPPGAADEALARGPATAREDTFARGALRSPLRRGSFLQDVLDERPEGPGKQHSRRGRIGSGARRAHLPTRPTRPRPN